MELHMHSHRWEQRMPNWTVAAVSGFAAGAVLMILELLWSTVIMGASPWAISNMVAAIVLGPDTLQATADFSLPIVATALVIHYVLGIALGLILAAILMPFHFDSSIGMATLTGAVFGIVVYIFNFYGMSHVFFWFAGMRGVAALLAHVIFGVTAAAMYWKFSQTEY